MKQDSFAAVRTVGVVGAGTMGRGIAQIMSSAGFRTRLYDQNPVAVSEAVEAISRAWEKEVQKGRLTEDKRAKALLSLLPAAALDDLADCDVIVEAIVEDLHVKQALFAHLEQIISDQAILASNTSSLSITAIQSACRRPGQVAGWHFFNPVPRMKLAEVVQGALTVAATVDTLVALTEHAGHKGITARDMPGFIVNHAGRAFIPEGLRILSEQIAEVPVIDGIMKGVAGFPMGPFELVDLIGLDVARTVMESLYDQYYQEARFRLHPLLGQKVAAGLLGRKSGQGFYIYKDAAVPDTSQVRSQRQPLASGRPVWVSPEHEDLAGLVRERLSSLDITIEKGPRPSPGALILVTPIGTDTSTSCIQQGLDPIRTIAVNALFGLGRHIELMRSPATSTATETEVCALFRQVAEQVWCVKDSPGFVSQRIVAQIVSIGCDIAQQGIGSPEDINLAARIALGYPQGPFEFGDLIGSGRVLTVCDALYEMYRDPRYRASAWLRRRAMLRLPLTHQD